MVIKQWRIVIVSNCYVTNVAAAIWNPAVVVPLEIGHKQTAQNWTVSEYWNWKHFQTYTIH